MNFYSSYKNCKKSTAEGNYKINSDNVDREESEISGKNDDIHVFLIEPRL